MVKLLDIEKCVSNMEPVHFISTFIQQPGCTQLDLGRLLGECESAQGVIMVTARPSVQFILG